MLADEVEQLVDSTGLGAVVADDDVLRHVRIIALFS
jgi:hypothetical protein